MLKLTKISFILLVFAIFVTTLIAWPGSKLAYSIFSAVFTLLLYSALKARVSAGYVFLAIALWIGYWLKLSIHIIEPTLPWMEPTGLFDFGKKSWDEVLLISSIGAVAVFVVGTFFLSIKQPPNKESFLKVNNIQQANLFWVFGIIVVISITLLNEIFNIVHAPIPQSYLAYLGPYKVC